MTDQPSLHDHLSDAFKDADYDLPTEQRRALADVALTALKQELDALADYENRITWHTSCGSCARVLDSSIRETERAERAEGLLASVLAAFPDAGPDGPAIRSRPLPAELVHRWKQNTTGGDGHLYLSTGCLHDQHDYCQSHTGLSGAKRPASCKWCAARCVCPCHQQAATEATEPDTEDEQTGPLVPPALMDAIDRANEEHEKTARALAALDTDQSKEK